MASGIVESGSKDRESEREQRGGTNVPRARFMQKLMQAGSDLPAFIKGLIETQGIVVAGTEAAAFLIEPGQEENTFGLRPIAHVRPDESTEEVRNKALRAFADIIRPCVEQGKDGVIEIDASKQDVEPQFCLVTLLRSESQVVAVSAVIARAPNLDRAQQRLSSMELVAGYFEMFTLRKGAEQSRAIAQTNQNVLQLATSVATAEGFASAGMALCNELATRTGATRVAIGWVHGNKIKLKAMSHTEKFDKKQELSVQIVAAMEECWDNQDIVQYEPDGTSSENVTRASAELSRTQGGVSVLSIPLRRIGEIVGVVTMEFNSNKKLGPNAATGLAVAVELLAPQLYDRFQNDRWWITKTCISIRETTKLAVGPKHMLAKLVILLVLGGLLFTALYHPMYHVVAPFQFSTTEKRIVSAPYEGFVGTEIYVKPGDIVKAGDPLLQMDTTELKLQLQQKRSTYLEKTQEAQMYAADPTKTSEGMQAKYAAEAAKAEAQLLEGKIEKGTIRAPIDGVVMSGDWKDRRRSPVRMGDELFKIADPKNLRIEMSVAERDIQDIKDRDPNQPQKGWLATSSLPTEKTEFIVDRIVPLPITEHGANVYKVYGVPKEINGQWRDGMQGEVRVEVRERALFWIWTHRFVDWVRIKLWI